MEHKDILAVVLAAFLVIVVIGVIGTVRSSEDGKEPAEDSVVVTERPPLMEQTDIWDVIHDQQAAMTTTEAEGESTDVTEPVIVTDEEGNAVTDEEGNPVTEPTEAEPEDPDAPEAVTQDTEETATETTTEAKRPDVPAQTQIEISIG